jgi:nucleoside-diphosphate-sugar epimerase
VNVESIYAPYRNVSVVVLGASGFIGRWVARQLCAAGARPWLVVRDAAAAEAIFRRYEIQGAVAELDLTHQPAVRAFLAEARAAIVFNLAGYGVDPSERSEALAHCINTELVRTVCDFCVSTHHRDWPGQHLVHVGSALEYGGAGGSLEEDTIAQPTTLYGVSKLAGTRALVASGARALTARLFTVYGPGEHSGRLLPLLLQAAHNQQALPLTAGLQRRDFTYVEDVAEGLLRLGLSSAQPGQIVNLATGQLHSVRQFVQAAAQVLGIPNERLDFGVLPTRTEEMSHAEVSVTRLQQLTSWLPRTELAEGIRRTCSFLGIQPASAAAG